MVKLSWTFLILLLNSTLHLCVKNKIECGYKQCPPTRDGALNVHLIAHSHMDAGWVKTFDEYYYGTKTSVSSANVQLIFHSVLSELLHDKRRKFTFSETAFFWRWWKEQRPATRATFRSLVQEGRVEFAGGGWTHADSATVSYLQTLDLWTWGLRKLNDTLGPCGKPKAAWQIDTYGHTREQVSLLAQMGFDGLFLGRVDYKDREEMMEEDRMEFMWRGSDVLGKMSDIMSHAMFNLYNAPNGFCFDWLCGDEPLVDDVDSPAYNADVRVNEFISQIERQAKYYDHDNILVTMGGDFTYQNAANWFMNMDKLINHVNTHPANLSDINIFYSSPSCYLKAIYLYGRRDKAIYTERGDYLPYGSDASTYWTGFYTSRPSLKYFARRSHVFLQVLKQISVITRTGDSYELHLLRHAVALILHHDAITGTSQQHVANDFVKILSEAVDTCTKKLSNLLSFLTPTWGGSRRSKTTQQFVVCHELNISQCLFAETQESLLVLVYNPLSVKTYHYVRIPAIALHYSIRDFNDEETEYQLNSLPSAMINLPGRSSTAIQELWFEAENIPPLGYSAYYVTPVRDQLEENQYKKSSTSSDADRDQELTPHISNEYLKVTIDKTTGLLESIQHADGVKIQVSQNFHSYSQGRLGLQSGAYSFRPEQSRPTQLTDRAQYHTVRGTLVKEIRQRFTDWISQVIRVYRGEELVELEWTIGPIPIGADLGKEVVSIFKTNMSTGGEFFTDSNGRQMMKRTCWNETALQQQKKPVSACYYPVTSRICINSHNSSTTMCVLTDRTQGGTSYSDGEIELMVHRRLLTDDGFGLEEPLNEEAYGVGMVVKGTHRILFGSLKNSGASVDDLTSSERMTRAARRWEMEPWLFFTSGDKVNRRKWQNVRNKRFSALRLHGLPPHIHVLTLEPWKGGSVLLRLENIFETTKRDRMKSDSDTLEDSKYHITVDLRKIFLHHKIRIVRETTLAANQWLDDARQMDWSTRYVYNGGDDGILPEDLPEEEDKSAKAMENNNSDEDPEYPRKYQNRRPHEKIRTRSRSPKDNQYYDRKKRALNESININDNIIINDTIKDFRLELQFNDAIETPNVTLEGSTTETYIPDNSTLKKEKRGRVLPKLSFWNRPKVKKTRLPFWEMDEEEVMSSEEDFSSNLKKRSPRKKPKNTKKIREDIIIDDSDDGITKSMYDMYYKPLPPRNPYRRVKHSEEVQSNRKKKTRRTVSEEVTDKDRKERTRRRSKKRRNNTDVNYMSDRRKRQHRQKEEVLDVDGELPLHEDGTQQRNLKRRGVDAVKTAKRSPYDYTDYYDEDDDEDYDEERSRSTKRKKRTPPRDDEILDTSEQDQNDVEYKMTLRPTQIRTFVIWFVNNRKSYIV